MPPHILHVFSTFGVGGPQVRTAAIINSLGSEFRHTILPMDGRREALKYLQEPTLCINPSPSTHPAIRPLQLRGIIHREQPELVITYNWGAIEAILAARTLMLPVIHIEDGFGPEEADRLLPRRVWARRVLLRTGVTTVVPSKTLERVALEEYRLPKRRVEYIPNGIDVKQFYPGRASTLRQSLGISEADIVFGAVGGLRPEKDLAFLLRAFRNAAIPNSWLVLVGEGPCRTDLEALVQELGIAGRVRFAGAAQDPSEHYRAFDIFVMSSITEQMPLALLEAMATGLPVICTKAGDTAEILNSKQPPQVLQRGNAEGYIQAMRTLARNSTMRRELGERNRDRCNQQYVRDEMVKRYLDLYRRALG